MTDKERLDRLTERHEALTESVELLVHQQQQMNESFLAWQKETYASQQTWERNHQKNQKLMAEILDSINSLARIAHDS
ncbi:MAG: hypothetical protein JO307_34135 [Bryobacterales bacterium]|nr:hypothetical protein [Bryobacterales bacterium]